MNLRGDAERRVYSFKFDFEAAIKSVQYDLDVNRPINVARSYKEAL